MVYDDIHTNYKNIDEYKFIPIGWSAGCFLPLDSALWTPNKYLLDD